MPVFAASAMVMVSLLAGAEPPRTLALARLADLLGPPAFLSAPLPFDHSHYYDREMGAPLNRRLALFNRLVQPWRLAEIKSRCLALETELAPEGRRQVNIDPGLLSAGGLTLASHKERPHRVAIGPGLWAEPTLVFQEGGFQPLPWTYPDYAGQEIRTLLNNLRRRCLWEMKRTPDQGGTACSNP